MNNITNRFKIQDMPVDELASAFGTPLYVYDIGKIVEQINTLKQAFAGARHKIKYAAKASSNITILKKIKQAGAGVDVVSIFEARVALLAGFSPEEIMFTPNGVAFDEILEGTELGLSINIDNLPTLEKFGKHFQSTYPCGLRLNPHIMAGGNLKISTGHSQSKFGISIQQLPEILKLVKNYKIKIQSLHIHTGSEIAGEEVYSRMADILFGMAENFQYLQSIDFGGGFKVKYKEDDKPTDIALLGKMLTEAFHQFHKETGRELELWIEPGKYVVSEAGYLLTRVNVVKETPTITFVGVDTGLNHLLRPMMYNAYHEIINGSNTEGQKKKYNVVGNICETDTLGAEREMHSVKEGDIIVIKNAGAYGFSMASNYNSRPRPAEILMENGVPKLIRKRETLDDLIRNQIF